MTFFIRPTNLNVRTQVNFKMNGGTVTIARFLWRFLTRRSFKISSFFILVKVGSFRLSFKVNLTDFFIFFFMFNLFQVPEHIPQFASLQTELASLAFN